MNRNRIQIQNSSGQNITSVEEWLQHAPPKRRNFHWKDGRSAKELAKAWFRHGVAAVPEEILTVMNTQAATKHFVGLCAIPEKTTKLDNFAGEMRNNDLVIYGHAAGGPIVVAIEAKADERFGNDEIGPYFDAKAGSTSNVPRRIEFLCKSVFGRPLDQEIRQLRYQLLHGLAAALIEANEQKASQAVFIVHEFRSEVLNAKDVETNHQDFQRFIQALIKKQDFILSPGSLVGPVFVLGGEFIPARLPVFIGKVIVHL
jgi:hypothetical protein